MSTQDETDSRRMTECRLCGNLVPADGLHLHLLADARLLRLIKANNPGWDRDLCEDYLRSLSLGGGGPRPSPQADTEQVRTKEDR